MENISRGPTFGDFVTILTEGYRLPSHPPLLNVMYCLCEDSQNIPCAPLKRRGSSIISIYLWSRCTTWLGRGRTAGWCTVRCRARRTRGRPRLTSRWSGVLCWYPCLFSRTFLVDYPCGRVPVTNSVRSVDHQKNENREEIFVEAIYW